MLLGSTTPTAFKVDVTFICNFKMKLKRLEEDYCKNGGVPLSELRKFFHPNSLKEAAKPWYADPIMEPIFKESMMEAMEEHADGKTKIFVVMEKVKQAVAHGYDYRVYFSDDGRPIRVLQMAPS